MLKFVRNILATTALLSVCSAAFADLVWSPDKGWEVRGGVLANVIGEKTAVSNAISAMNEARRAQEDGSRRTALSYYATVISEYPESIFAPEAYFQSAKLYLERGQFPSAYEYVEEIVKKYPDYPDHNKVIGLEYKIAADMQAGEIYFVQGWFPWFTSYKDIIKYYESVIKNAPYGDYAPIALMNISIVAEDEDQYDTAIDALERLINTYPESMFVSDAYIQMANVYKKLVAGPEYDQDPTRNAISFFQDFTILFPKEATVAEAEEGLEKMQDIYARSRLVMGDFFYYYRNNGPAAAIFYNETITIAPNSPAAEEAREKLKKIDGGIPAPMTPYDWFFGRYEKPSIDQFEDETRVENLENQRFEIMSAQQFENERGISAEADAVYSPLSPVYGKGLGEYLFNDGFYEWTEEEISQ